MKHQVFSKVKAMLSKVNPLIMLIPLLTIILLGILLTFLPEQSVTVINAIRYVLGDTMSIFYLLIGLGIFIVLLVLALTKFGKIKLGTADDKPMKAFTWGAMIFTMTMAGDLLFFSFTEWTYYYGQTTPLSNVTDEATAMLTYSFFHWGFIPWAIYLVLAAAYAFLFFVRKRRDHQAMSEACRPLLGKQTDGPIGKSIDILTIIGLLLGTATTFSITTPLMTAIVTALFPALAGYDLIISIVLLLITASIYSTAVLAKKSGIPFIAKLTTIVFATLMALVFVLSDMRYTLELGFQSLGQMIQNFIPMATWLDPNRSSGFPQVNTVFYWAYWLAWCTATPFFIAKISKGRTLKQMLLGGLLAGSLGTFASFTIFGSFAIHWQQTLPAGIDFTTLYPDVYAMTVGMIQTIVPGVPAVASIIMFLVLAVIILLYSSTFDALTEVVSAISYKRLDIEASAKKPVKIFWLIIFLILPIALLILTKWQIDTGASTTTKDLLMSVSIIGAFPISIIVILIIVSFFKDLLKHKKEVEQEHESNSSL